MNVWNANISVPGNPEIKGMMQVSRNLCFFSIVTKDEQPRFANGTFNFTDPRHCSIHDPAQATCFLNAANRDGFYEGGYPFFKDFRRLTDVRLGSPIIVSASRYTLPMLGPDL